MIFSHTVDWKTHRQDSRLDLLPPRGRPQETLSHPPPEACPPGQRQVVLALGEGGGEAARSPRASAPGPACTPAWPTKAAAPRPSTPRPSTPRPGGGASATRRRGSLRRLEAGSARRLRGSGVEVTQAGPAGPPSPLPSRSRCRRSPRSGRAGDEGGPPPARRPRSRRLQPKPSRAPLARMGFLAPAASPNPPARPPPREGRRRPPELHFREARGAAGGARGARRES